MQAKEYIQVIQSHAIQSVGVVAVLEELHDKLQELCKSRNTRSFSDSLSSYDEVNLLWQAIARKMNLPESIFHDSMIVVYPELKTALDARATRRKRLR
jgi:hypothetical protein